MVSSCKFRLPVNRSQKRFPKFLIGEYFIYISPGFKFIGKIIDIQGRYIYKPLIYFGQDEIKREAYIDTKDNFFYHGSKTHSCTRKFEIEISESFMKLFMAETQLK